MIIIEGLDATGKSTLAAALQKTLSWSIITSEGPEKYPGEILRRCFRYSKFQSNVIYDRHPIISQSVYSRFSNTTKLPPNFITWLKVQKPIVVYASSDNYGEHQIKAHDTPSHLKMIAEKRLGLELEYLKLLNEHFPGFTVYRFGGVTEVVEKINKQLYG